MDTTVRNLDESAYRATAPRRAVMEGRTVGALITEAIRGIWRAQPFRGASSLRLLRPEPYPPGSEQLSMEIDEIVYGIRR